MYNIENIHHCHCHRHRHYRFRLKQNTLIIVRDLFSHSKWPDVAKRHRNNNNNWNNNNNNNSSTRWAQRAKNQPPLLYKFNAKAFYLHLDFRSFQCFSSIFMDCSENALSKITLMNYAKMAITVCSAHSDPNFLCVLCIYYSCFAKVPRSNVQKWKHQ